MFSLHSLELFLLILTFSLSSCFPPVQSPMQALHRIFILPPNCFFCWLTKMLVDSNAFNPSRTPIALKGTYLKAFTARPSQSLPPLSSRMHCAMKMMNDAQWYYRVLFLTARRWELYQGYIFLQRGNKTRWFSPVSEVTFYISEMPKAIAVGSFFPVSIPSLLPPSRKSPTSREHHLGSLPGGSLSLTGDDGAEHRVPQLHSFHFSFCRKSKRKRIKAERPMGEGGGINRFVLTSAKKENKGKEDELYWIPQTDSSTRKKQSFSCTSRSTIFCGIEVK